MKKKLPGILIRYGTATLIGGLMVYATLSLHGFADAASNMEKYRILCDAFTIPGSCLILFGVLVMVANHGAFEGISFAVNRAVNMLLPFSKKEHIRYYDYVERKRKKGKVKGYSFLFFTGLAFMVVALVFFALFYKNY